MGKRYLVEEIEGGRYSRNDSWWNHSNWHHIFN